MSIETGGPAFPATHVEGGSDGIGCKDGIWHFPGMTLRDYFAAAALTGILASPNFDKQFSYATEVAWRYADEMLKVRGQE